MNNKDEVMQVILDAIPIAIKELISTLPLEDQLLLTQVPPGIFSKIFQAGAVFGVECMERVGNE